MIRKPIVAGKFYSEKKEDLYSEIAACFSHHLGPKKNPSSKSVLGVISPHAGYTYSGPAQAWGFNELRLIEPDTIVLLGLSHNGYPNCVSLSDFKTPLGIHKNDREFITELVGSGIPINEEAHAIEHSIEVQLPFLQYLKIDAKIAPIIVSNDYHSVAQTIFKTIQKIKRKVLVIASSDFTHYGMHYGFFPFTDQIKEKLYDFDRQAIKYIEKLDSVGFMDYINKTGATICGKYPIATMIELGKLYNKKSKLLKYYTSGDIAGDYSSAVGYASIKFD